MTVYQIIMIILWVLLIIILGYDMRHYIEGSYKYHFIRIFVAMLLAIAIIYDAVCWDNSIEQENAKNFEQQFEIKKPNEEYITKFQQEFLQNIIDVKMKDIKSDKTLVKPANTKIYITSNEIVLIPINNKGYISLDIQTNRFDELETNNYFKRNKEKFKKSLKDNPIKAETLVKILKNDLNDDFAITKNLIEEANGIENQWIVISWK